MAIIGLDISTSCTGLAVLDDNGNLIELSHIDFKKCKNYWQKIDFAEQEIHKICLKYKISSIFIEEPLMSFGGGKSTAFTLALLNRFNFTLSYIIRNITKITPIHISSAQARKSCGIKVQRTSIVGISGKEQAYNWAIANDLKHIIFENKKTGKPKDFNFDQVDAYIVARGGFILNHPNKVK